MFDIRQVNFANGVYGNCGKINGLEVMAMESSEAADKVINDFAEIIKVELSPYAALDQAFERNNISEDDLTDFDLQRINRKVNAIYKSATGGNY
jgi:hypothetical protein